ncbi:MAG: glycosyltransferase, partial [Acidobacteria bacterium]|nr:glycosyltransferase [Acidobacteriota bacterium]
MKLLHIDTGRDFRGGQELLLALARGLGERGHAQTIVCPARSPLVKHLRADGLHVLPYPGILALRRVAGRERFDLVHAHDGRAQNLAFLASAGLPVRRVASRHVAFAPRHPFIHRVKYDLTCHGVIALSESVRAVLRGAGVRDEKIVVIPPGIDFPDRLPTPEERIRARRELGIADDEF